MMRDPICGGLHLTQHPKAFALTCDPVAFVEGVHWNSWGGATAHATGTLNVAELRGATSVADAPRRRYPATIVASHVEQCAGRRIYKYVQIHFMKAGKRRHTELPPFVCPNSRRASH